MTKRGRPSGWQLRNAKVLSKWEVVPATPTRWELFCCANRIDDPLAALQNGKRKLIIDFVHKHHDNAFIPEPVLLDLGIITRWEN